jgi:hypothetical protein
MWLGVAVPALLVVVALNDDDTSGSNAKESIDFLQDIIIIVLERRHPPCIVGFCCWHVWSNEFGNETDASAKRRAMSK